jgi:hypothetical protein
MSAYVDSSELYATSNPSRLDLRRNGSFECEPMDDSVPLRKDTVAYAIIEDEIFYRDDFPGSVHENDSISPTSSPVLQDLNSLVDGNYMLEPLAEEEKRLALGSEHWISIVCLPSFYAVGLCD